MRVGHVLSGLYCEHGDVWDDEGVVCEYLLECGVGRSLPLRSDFVDELNRMKCWRFFRCREFDCWWVREYGGDFLKVRISEILFYVWDPVFLWRRDEDIFGREFSGSLNPYGCDVMLSGFKEYCDDYFGFIGKRRGVFSRCNGVSRFIFNIFEDAVFEALQSGFGQSELEDCLFDWAMTHFGPEVMPSIFLGTAAEHEEQLRFRSALASQKIMEVVRSAC